LVMQSSCAFGQRTVRRGPHGGSSFRTHTCDVWGGVQGGLGAPTGLPHAHRPSRTHGWGQVGSAPPAHTPRGRGAEQGIRLRRAAGPLT
jgi:hypothetical protein